MYKGGDGVHVADFISFLISAHVPISPYRGGSRISGKRVHMYKGGGGVRFADFI